MFPLVDVYLWQFAGSRKNPPHVRRARGGGAPPGADQGSHGEEQPTGGRKQNPAGVGDAGDARQAAGMQAVNVVDAHTLSAETRDQGIHGARRPSSAPSTGGLVPRRLVSGEKKIGYSDRMLRQKLTSHSRIQQK